MCVYIDMYLYMCLYVYTYTYHAVTLGAMYSSWPLWLAASSPQQTMRSDHDALAPPQVPKE